MHKQTDKCKVKTGWVCANCGKVYMFVSYIHQITDYVDLSLYIHIVDGNNGGTATNIPISDSIFSTYLKNMPPQFRCIYSTRGHLLFVDY